MQKAHVAASANVLVNNGHNFIDFTLFSKNCAKNMEEFALTKASKDVIVFVEDHSLVGRLDQNQFTNPS